MLAVSLLFLLGAIYLVSTRNHSIDEALLLLIPVTLFFTLSSYLEVLCYRCAAALNQTEEYELPDALQHQIYQTRILGWIVLCLPLLLFGPPLILAASVVLSGTLIFLVIVIIGAIYSIKTLNKRADESELLWLLAVCVEKNIPIADELDTYAYTLKKKHRERVQLISSRLYSGDRLSDALAITPGLIPQSAVVSIRIGEESNSLAIALRDAAVQSTRKLKHFTENSPLSVLLFYLTFVVSIQFLVASYIMVWIIPKFHKIFQDFGFELPLITRNTIEASEFFSTYFYLFLPLLSLPIMALVLLQAGNYYGWYNLRIPFFTGWFPRLNTPHCLRQIAQSISMSESPQTALNSISTYHRWYDVRAQSQSASKQIRQGDTLWLSLQNAKIINEAEAALCTTAERTQNISFVLRTLAETIEQRRTRKLRFLSESLKPVLISILAFLIGYFVIALFMPLLQLIHDLSLE